MEEEVTVEHCLLSVDPGLRACGVAVWKRDQGSMSYPVLRWAGLVKNTGEAWSSMVHAVEHRLRDFFFFPTYLAIEMPQIYNRTHWKGDPDDLIQLAGLVGAFVYFYDARNGSKQYKPAAWKGQVKKDITELRVKMRLSAEELARVELPSAAGLRHNVWDGIGIGLYHSRRR